MLEVSLLEFRGIYFQVLQSSMGQARSKPSWQLRHGIYNHPNCVDGIVRWLRRVTWTGHRAKAPWNLAKTA